MRRRRGVLFRLRGRLAADTVFLARPLTEIDQAAAFAADRAPGLFRTPFHVFAAGRALHLQRHIMQQVISKWTSCVVCSAWLSGCCSLFRSVLRCWLLLSLVFFGAS